MKTRHCFVSNSSSSSFIVWGITYDGDKDELDSKLYKSEDTILEGSYGDPNLCEGSFYVGASPFCMNNDETLIQFKQRIIDEFNRFGLTKYSVNDLEEISMSWYDG